MAIAHIRVLASVIALLVAGALILGGCTCKGRGGSSSKPEIACGIRL